MDPHQGHAVALGPGFFFRSIDGGIALEFLNKQSKGQLNPKNLCFCVSSCFRDPTGFDQSAKSVYDWRSVSG